MKLELFLWICVGFGCFRFGGTQEDGALSWPDNNNNNDVNPMEDHIVEVSHNVADALVEVVSEATDVLNLVDHNTHNNEEEEPENNNPPHHESGLEMDPTDNDNNSAPSNQRCKKKNGIWKRWARKKFQRGGGTYCTERSDPQVHHVDANTEAPPKEPTKKQKRLQRAFEAFRFRNKADMEETMAGSRLLSGSFRLLSSTAGFVASTVRVSGDTAAGIMGSSIKIVGSGVKTMGAGCSAASRLLETRNKEQDERDNGDSSTPSKGSRYATDGTYYNDSEQSSSLLLQVKKYKQQKKHRSTKKFVKRSQKVAAKSVRLLGNVMDGLGETLLIVGVAAESLTSATAGVAEETVRIVEELAGTISIAISLRSEQRRKRKHYYKSNNNNVDGNSQSFQNDLIIKRQFTPPSFLSFGTYSEGSLSEGEKLESLQSRWMREPSMNHSLELLGLLASDMAAFGRSVSADVEGVPSMASELAAALLFCHLVAVLVFYRRPARRGDKGGIKNVTGSEAGQYTKKLQYSYYWFKSKSVPLRSMVSKDYCHGATITTSATIQFVSSALQWCFVLFVKLPYTMLRYSFKILLGVIFSRHTFLFLVYGLVWAFLSRQSQNKALLVQRHASAVGFRNGLATLSETSNNSMVESTLWLNHFLREMWRVDSKDTCLPYQYPTFVRRALKATSTTTYGGLEPYLASAIGSGIVRGLEIAKSLRPTDVAYVSLFSLSLGSQPPILKSIKLINQNIGEQNRIEVYFEVDAFLEDLAMVLEVKLSSLRYALLPSTQIKVHNVNFRASFKAVLSVIPQYPFVSSVELSMLEQPVCDIRVTPVSKDSFLHGVDLGSIPFLDDWVKEAIRAGLSNYVSPRYVSIGVEELLHSNAKSKLEAPGANLDNLRRNTRFSVSNPRTSIPEGIAITSIADKLEAHHTSSQYMVSDTPALEENPKQKSILKPMTELSRLALDRHAMKQENRIRPATELARLGLDRWLDSKIMMKYSDEDTIITDIDNLTG